MCFYCVISCQINLVIFQQWSTGEGQAAFFNLSVVPPVFAKKRYFIFEDSFFFKQRKVDGICQP